MLGKFPKFKEALNYLPEDDVTLVDRALALANKAHKGQVRKSGEDYITHPVAVATIIANLRLDPGCIAASLLHDVIEDTDYNYRDILRKFDKDIADLVEGVTKIKRIPAVTRYENQAENFRKLLMAMCKDIRVLIIKLADRLHNMQTIEFMPRKHQLRVALETLDIYAPLARRLGVNSLASELETLGFEVKHPIRAKILQSAILRAQGYNSAMLTKITDKVNAQLVEKDIKIDHLKSREKHVYSVYKKMQDKGISFAEITDMFAIRICVEDVNICYQVLGIVHSLYRPVPGAFKDYIALPKANGYQSLHTILFGPNSTKIEVQIRTIDMDQVANSGVAAHCLYKAKVNKISKHNVQSQEWLSRLMTMQKHVGSTLEFMEHVKIDLCPDEIYVFTPQGDIIELPLGACVLDFAYAIHTEMGNQCVFAKIDQQIRPLSTVLSNGQTIAVTTKANAKPSHSWLAWVKTAKARTAIRYAIRVQKKDDLVTLGKKLLKKFLTTSGYDEQVIETIAIREVAHELKLGDADSLFEALALGGLAVRKVGALISSYVKLRKGEKLIKVSSKSNPLVITDSEHAAMTYAACCYPIPGDKIRGVIEVGKGVVVHQEQCNNYQNLPDSVEKFPLKWGNKLNQKFQAGVELHISNQRGALAMASVIVANEHADVQDLNIKIIDEHEALIRLILWVEQTAQLSKIIRTLARQPSVYRVERFAMDNVKRMMDNMV